MDTMSYLRTRRKSWNLLMNLPQGRVEQHLKEWVALARSKALAAQGKVLEA